MFIGNRKDVWTGFIYIAIGAVALAVARNYSVGSTGRMGPGYFPIAVAVLLLLVGVVILLRAFLRDGVPLEAFAWKPMLLVLGSIAAFGFLIERAGFIIAAAVLVLGCAAASDRFKLAWFPLVGMALLIGLCILGFVIGMGVPMPLVGRWFLGSGI